MAGSSASPLRFFAYQVREETAHQRRGVQFQRQVHAEGENEGGHGEHFHRDRNQCSDTKKEVCHRLAAHEAFDQGFHDGGLGRRQYRPSISSGGFTKLKGLGQQDDR